MGAGRIRLIGWNAAEARERAGLLRAAGYEVASETPQAAAFRQELRNNPPRAVVIDLDRLPAQGRDVGIALRHAKATRHVPLVFAGGEPEKVARVRQSLPDAVYCSWDGIHSAVKRALTHPPADPVKPASALAGYSGTPLPKKLGIKPGSVVGLLGAPPGFRTTLGELPAGAVLRQGAGGGPLTLWFARSRREVESRVRRMAVEIGDGALWIIWPKKASGVATDLTQQLVREVGLGAGLVDYKICAVDQTWSGLLFTRRKARRG